MMAFSYMELWFFKVVKLDVCGSLVLSNPVKYFVRWRIKMALKYSIRHFWYKYTATVS